MMLDFLRKSRYLLIGFIFTVVPSNAQVSGSQNRTIDASQYANLQSAVDALPASGGIIIIPPGEYELYEPLLIATENIRYLSGKGTGIINYRTNGC